MRFDGAALDGAALDGAALPSPPPGCLNVLGQVLSPGAYPRYLSAQQRWRAARAARAAAEGNGAPPLPWAEFLTPLGDDCLADERAVTRALGEHLGLTKARARVRALAEEKRREGPDAKTDATQREKRDNATQGAAALLPTDPPVHPVIEVFTIGLADARVALRGQARAACTCQGSFRPSVRALTLIRVLAACAARSAACARARRWARARWWACCAARR
jgi:hypothetical protein